jgi:hypothetical protein
MPRLANRSEGTLPAAPLPVVQETVTTKTTTQTAPLPFSPPARAEDAPKEDVNKWFQKLDPDYRVSHVSYYLYREDPNIQVIQPVLEGRAQGSFLYKFTPALIQKFAEGVFTEELQSWTKEEFGGGTFHCKINDTKIKSMMYVVRFKNEGPARLSARESYAGGSAPGGQAGVGDQNTVRMLIEFIDKKLDSVNTGRQDPGAALSQVASVIMESNNRAFQWVLENRAKEANPADQLNMMKSMFEMFKTLQPQAPPPAAPAPTIIEQIQTLTAIMDAAEKMRAQRNPENQHSLATQIAEAIAKAGIARAKGTDFSWITEGLRALAPALDPIGMALAEKIKAAGGPPGAPAPALTIHGRPVTAAPQVNRATSGPVGQASGPGMPPGVPGMGPAGPPALASPANPQAPAAGPQVITQEMVDAVHWDTAKKRLVSMLQNGDTGDVAAASINNIFPKVAGHLSMATPEILMGMIGNDEILREVKDDPRLPAFLQSFCEWFKGGEEEDEGDELPAVQ